MLIGFSFRNFRSYLTEQTFSFLTSSDRTHASTHLLQTGMKSIPRVSKSAIVFGPNASGKTNLLVAVATFRDLILHSTSFSDAEFSERHTPFKFGPSASQATEFEFDVLLNRIRYRYSLSYDSQRVLSERLLVYRTGKSQRWFDRHYDTQSQRDVWAPFSPNFNGPREMWRKATRPKALFLTTATQLNAEQSVPLMQWIEHGLEILLPADRADVNRIAKQIEDEHFKSRVVSLLSAVDIPIDDVRVAERDSPKSLPRQSIEFLHARAGCLPTWLDSVFEAAGTQRLIGLLGPLLRAIEKGSFLLIDEFDVGLHPLVARYLLRLVNDPLVSSKGAQLLLTSHNTTLMDLNILRRDEIWLVQLNAQHAGTLLPILRSSPRKHEMIAKNYLSGRYGALPQIRSAGVASRRRAN